MSLKKSFVLLFILSTLIPLIILSYIYDKQFNKAQKSLAFAALRLSADFKEEVVLGYFQQIKQITTDFSSDGLIQKKLLTQNLNREEYDQLNKHLRENKIPANEDVKAIFFYGKDGNLLTSTIENPHQKKISLKQKLYLDKNRVHLDINRLLDNQKIHIEITKQVLSNSKKLLGYIKILFGTETLNEIMTGVHGKKLGAQTSARALGKTGELYLVNQDKLMLTDSLFIKDAVLQQKVNTIPVEECLKNKKELIGVWKDYRGVRVAGSSMCLKIGGKTWTLLSEQDESEIFSSLQKIRTIMLFLIIILIALSSFIAFMFSRKITIPMDLLRKGVIKIGEGQLDQVIHIKSGNKEIKELTDSFNEMGRNLRKISEEKTQVEAANNAKNTFIANMSHDLRTPLNLIIGMTDVLKEGKLEQGDIDSILNSISRAGDTLLTIINDILDLSKIEAGKIELENGILNIEELVDYTVRLHTLACSEKGIEISSEISNDLPLSIWGDDHYLKRVLVNLVNNAVKFTNHGHVKLKVYSEDDQVTFSVEDTGIGISKKQKEKILNPFTQEDSSTTRKFGGTGLGTSIVNKLASLMNGKFWFKSEKGKGSVFYFSIPLKQAPAPRKKEAKEKIPPSIELPSMRILQVDDTPENNDLINLYLKKHPIDLTFALNGEEAIAKYREHHSDFDLILMDLQMPIMNGYDAIKEIRNFEKENNIKSVFIIALSASILEEEVRKAILSGCDMHIAKPVSKTRLTKALYDVATVIGKRKLIEWEDIYLIGDKKIDNQHYKIFDYINSLHHSIGHNEQREVLERIIFNLLKYTEEHLKHEEAVFNNSDYPDKERHIKEHQFFTAEINKFKLRIESGEIVTADITFFLKAWLIEHIARMDKDYSYYISLPRK